MDAIGFIEMIGGVLWGPWTFFVLMGAGILFTVWTKFVQFRIMTHGISVVKGDYDDPNDPGAINHFQALSAALSATVGLGNIGGVALAIGLGGPGALFWMWIVGFLGMALKTVEITLAQMYRNVEDPDNPSGGAMWVIHKTLGQHDDWRKWLAKALAGFFCFTLIISTMTGGNMFQAWNVADILNIYFGIPQVATGITLAVVVGAVIIGGIKRIGDVAGKIVPLMCAMYIIAALVVIGMNIAQIPAMLALVVKSAFQPVAAGGAFVGIGAYAAFEVGLKRALFSNEAGQGSAPIAHAAAKTDESAREGIVGGIGPFIDTILICTLTALVILSTGTWNRDPVGELKGNVALEQVGGKLMLNAPTEVKSLPQLESWENWQAGNEVFFVMQAPGEDGNMRRIKVHGRIIAGVTADADALAWDEPPKGATWLMTDGKEDKRIYRKFSGASLTAHAFDRAVPGLGKWMVSLASILFAISTMISWSYYGEQGMVYLFQGRFIIPYKMVFLLCAIAAPTMLSTTRELGALADFGTGWMLWANMPIILTMGYLAVREVSTYFKSLDAGEFQKVK